MRETLRIGAEVRAADRVIGEVVRLEPEPVAGADTRVVVRRTDGQEAVFPLSALAPADSGAWSLVDEAGVTTAAEGADRLVIPVRVEELEASKRSVESGTLRIEKRVETAPVDLTVEALRDDVTVERVPVNRVVEAVPEPRWEGDTLIVPVVEEEIVVSKRLVVRDEVRIVRRSVAEPVTLTETVRREVVRVERVDRGGDGIEYAPTSAGDGADVASPDG